MNDMMFPALPVLIVDDESIMVRSTTLALRAGGITHCIACQDSREVMGLLAERPIGVIMLDLIMPYVRGEELLPQIVAQFPELPVLVVTGAHDVATAVECMRLGAFDYLVKPVEPQRLISAVKRAVELRELRREYASLKERMFSPNLEHPEAFASILTISPKMQAIFRFAETIAKTPKPVLIAGETGVGKELVAKAIATLSGRPAPFVAVNVAGVDDHVFSDTLFGHVRGAYTGADTVRPGLLEQAARGTIFLDEIGDLSSASQVKLLRLLQEREYFSMGADAPKMSDARVLVATNRDLETELAEGRFRADLYYRLQIHRIHVPPLRERLEDLPLLLDHFLNEAARVIGKQTPLAPRGLVNLLASYHFPGNIRELEAMIYTAVGRHVSGKLSLDVFQEHIERGRTSAPGSAPSPPEGKLAPIWSTGPFPTLKETTEALIAEAMRRANGNQTIAAELLGISSSALSKRLRRGLEE